MKHQVLFSVKNSVKLFKTVVCCSRDWRLRANWECLHGWPTRDFISFSKVFQSYQDNETMIMKGCV